MSNLELSPEWTVDALSDKEQKKIVSIFNQPFVYLKSGKKCYAFISSDQQYVLKFFKMKRFLPKRWLSYFPLLGLDQYGFNYIEKHRLRQRELFINCKLAYQMLPEESGLVFIHLNKTKDLGITCTLIDKKGKHHLLKLDQFEFVLQRKAQPAYEKISQLIESGQRLAAVSAMRALLVQVVNQCKQGLVDKENGMDYQYGFIGDKVVHFGVEYLMKDENAKNPFYYQREILRFAKKLEQWLSNHYPELLPDLDECVTQLVSAS